MAATRWTEAEAAFRANQSSLTSASAVSLADWRSGPMGTDIGACVRFRDRKWLWLFGDSWMPTAKGQDMGGAAGAGQVANTVCLQQGSADLPAATLTWHCKGTVAAPTAFFPSVTLSSNINPPTASFKRYPFGGIRLDDKILVVGRLSESKTTNPNNFNTTMNGPWGCLLSGVDDNDPINWTQTFLTWPMSSESFHTTGQYGCACSPIDQGDGYVYFPMQGPAQSSKWAMARAPRSEVYAGTMTNLTWWAGGAVWVKDASTTDPDNTSNLRRQILGFSINQSDQPGAMHKRRNGQWQFTSIPFDWGDLPYSDGLHSVGWSTADGPADLFSGHSNEYAIPLEFGNTNQFAYSGMYCDGIRPSGAADSDQVWVYSININPVFGDFSALTDARAYNIKFLKVPGIDG